MGSQTDQIVDHIVREIEQGTLMPGDVLDEKSLVGRFGVSRTPVREALLQLDAVGILRRKPRGGAEVFKPNLEEFLAILEVHAKLEGHAAGLAASRFVGASASRQSPMPSRQAGSHGSASSMSDGGRDPATHGTRPITPAPATAPATSPKTAAPAAGGSHG